MIKLIDILYEIKEIKINQPIVIKNFPIILNRDNVDKVFKFLNDLGYKWTGGDSLLTKDDVYYIIIDKLSNGEKIYLSGHENVNYGNEIYYSEEKDMIRAPERLKIIPIKRQGDKNIDEIKIVNPNNKKYQEIWDECWDNAMDEIAIYDDDDDTEIVNEDDVSDLARHLFFEKTGKKVDDLDLQEIKVNRPPKMWDLDKKGVKFDNIKVGDILQFTLYQPWKERVKQKVTSVDNRYIRTHYLTDKDEFKTVSGEDVWTKNDIETYYQLNKVDEIKVNQPIQIKIPLIINSAEEYKKLVPILNTQGYTWRGLSFKESDLMFITFPIKFEFNNSDKDLRL